MIIRWLFPIIGCFFSTMLWANNLDQKLLEDIQTRYSSISSFQGKFIQHNQYQESSRTMTAKGTVTYLKPGRMRWDYAEPAPQELITNGETLWLYDPVLENVTIHPLKEVTQGTALSFLLGVGKLQDDFKQRPISEKDLISQNLQAIELEAKKKIPGIKFIQLGIQQKTYDIREVVLADIQGNLRKITFEKMNYNLPLKPENFEFEVPLGLETIRPGE